MRRNGVLTHNSRVCIRCMNTNIYVDHTSANTQLFMCVFVMKFSLFSPVYPLSMCGCVFLLQHIRYILCFCIAFTSQDNIVVKSVVWWWFTIKHTLLHTIHDTACNWVSFCRKNILLSICAGIILNSSRTIVLNHWQWIELHSLMWLLSFIRQSTIWLRSFVATNIRRLRQKKQIDKKKLQIFFVVVYYTSNWL